MQASTSIEEDKKETGTHPRKENIFLRFCHLGLFSVNQI